MPERILDAPNMATDRKSRRQSADDTLQDRFDKIVHEYELLSQIVDVSADAIISIDADQKIVRFNGGARKIFGYSSEETIGNSIDMFLPVEFKGNHADHIDGFQRSSSKSQWMDRRGEIAGRRKDGSVFPARATIAKATHGGSTIMTVFLRDISEIKEAASRIDRVRDDLAHVSRGNTLGEISASLAHELNQPLTAILANAQVLKQCIAAPSACADDMTEVSSDIAADATRAAGVIRRLRALLERRNWQVEPVDINALIDDTVNLLRSELLIRQVDVRTDLDPDLTAVVCDRIQMQQVLLNLLTNAIDATVSRAPQGRKILLSTRIRKLKSVEISVKDSGTGFVGLTYQEIISPYFTTKEKGLGMGLSISRSILEKFGGRLSAANNSDSGATFRVVLPITKPEAVTPAVRSGVELARDIPECGTVFIVDDDQSIRTSLSRLVKSAGYRVESFASAEAYEERKEFVGIGCVVLDLHMPGASGLELQSKIRRRGFNLPIIFITGGGDTESSVRAMKEGAADFLTKPIIGEELLKTIGIATRKSKAAIEQERIILMARSLVEKLTPRETEIMGLVVKGMRNKQIAGELDISEKTVKAHRGSVMRKVGARTLADLIHISKTAAINSADR